MTAAKSPLCTPEAPTLASRSLGRMSGVWTLVKRRVMVSLTLLLATYGKKSSRRATPEAVLCFVASFVSCYVSAGLLGCSR